MRVEVLLNAAAGTSAPPAASSQAVTDALAAVGVEAVVREVHGRELYAAAADAAKRGADAVIAAGGDGTVSAVASALAGGQTPLGVLPIGTLNHFAKDLGLPLDVAAAAQVIAARHVARIDVGRVADRVFINNSSVGVYARALVERDARRQLHGWSKWPAMVAAALKVFKRHPMIKVRIQVDGRPLQRKTPLLFIGNNCYELDLLHIGQRACLTDGALSLYIANTSTRWGMFKLALRAAVGRLKQSRDFETFQASEIRVETSRRRVRVALDGEVTSMTPPLEFRIDPQALPVIVPNQTKPPNESSSARSHEQVQSTAY